MDAGIARSVAPLGSRVLKRERSFDMPLSAFVRGQTPRDEAFSETAEVASISAEEAVLRLDSPVTYGDKILLRLRIPSTRLLEAALEMSLSGTIRSIGTEMPGPPRRRLISIRLDRSFRIQPIAP
jgi:hypothetical protein